MELGATFVARSFSGDKQQLIPLIKAALSHEGFAFIDVISPCVTFNNNDGSTKSYDYVREHVEGATSAHDFIPHENEITVSYQNEATVTLHDGSSIQLKKLNQAWDPTKKKETLENIQKARAAGQILTGLYYINPESKDLHATINSSPKPLNSLKETDLCPGQNALVKLNAGFR